MGYLSHLAHPRFAAELHLFKQANQGKNLHDPISNLVGLSSTSRRRVPDHKGKRPSRSAKRAACNGRINIDAHSRLQKNLSDLLDRFDLDSAAVNGKSVRAFACGDDTVFQGPSMRRGLRGAPLDAKSLDEDATSILP